jgi:uncharacterized membrane protein
MNDEENKNLPDETPAPEPASAFEPASDPDRGPAPMPPPEPPASADNGPDAPPPPPPADAQPEATADSDMSAEDIEKGKIFSILLYIIPLFILVPIIQRDNKFSLYHAKQGLMLVILGVVGSLLSAVPLLGCIISPVTLIAVVTFAIMGIINAVNGVAKPLPIIGEYGIEWFKGLTLN